MLGSELGLCGRDCLGVGVESENARDFLGQAGCQSPVAAADLDHGRAGEVGEAAQRREVDTFRVEDGRHRL
ncbi:MAG: hypothetical protein ACRDNI_11830 [Gaiellaceae bacterium]